MHREIALMKLVAPHPHLVELFDVYETRDDLSVDGPPHISLSSFAECTRYLSVTGISSRNIALEENCFNTFKLTFSLLSKYTASTLSSSVQSVQPSLISPECD